MTIGLVGKVIAFVSQRGAAFVQAVGVVDALAARLLVGQ